MRKHQSYKIDIAGAGAAIFIGGEANSEIEKAAAEAGHTDVRRRGERRSGGVASDGNAS
jgi:hypothetical protein